MKKNTIIFFLFFWNSIFANEPSAFNAGNLNNKKPYGLTPIEKAIYKNNQEIFSLRSRNKRIVSEIQSITDNIDGLKSVLNGQMLSLFKIKQRLVDIQTSYEQLKQDRTKNTQTIKVLKKQNELLKNHINSLTKKNKMDINRTTSILLNLEQQMGSYVTKESFLKVVDDMENFKQKLLKELNMVDESTFFKGKSLKEIYKDANAAYRGNLYEKARKSFSHLIKNNYYPAKSSYLIGESFYYEKKYANAVYYYKKSISFYQKPSYLSTLLLHTAISLSKTNKKQAAKKFAKALVKKFPKSQAVKLLRESYSNLL